MANGLLQLIAQPQVADVVGQFQAGRQSVQNNALANLAMQQRQQQLDIGEQKLAINEQALAQPGIDAEKKAAADKLQKLSFDLVTIGSIQDPAKQRILADKFLQEAEGTILGSGAFAEQLRNASPGEETDVAVLQGIMNSQLTGIVEGGDALRADLERRSKEAAAKAKVEEEINKEERAEKRKIREDTRRSIDKEIKTLSDDAASLESNLNRVKNLAANIKTGNRTSVAQGLIALVKLGEPSSAVLTGEMMAALNKQNPAAAIASLITQKGGSPDLADAIASKIDPLDPLSIDTVDLIETANTIVGARVPVIQQQFQENIQRAEENLSAEGLRAAIPSGRKNRIENLSNLVSKKLGQAQPEQALQTSGTLEFLGFE